MKVIKSTLGLAVVAAVTVAATREAADEIAPLALRIDSIASPAASGSAEPNLTTAPNGRVYMTWIEPKDSAHSLRFAILDGTTWSAPRTIHTSRDMMVNWADFPALAVIGNDHLGAHWLQKAGKGKYSYGVRITQSRDNGRTWSAPITPHRDSSETEHGFVALWPDRGKLGAVWLDGRRYASTDKADHEMMLLSTTIAANGAMTPEAQLDARTCDCCQNSAAVTGDGPIVAYRDRSDKEIRDVYVTRRVNGKWTRGVPVGNDDWHIEACPVNGPSIAASGKRVAVAWFASPNDKSRVNVAFSDNGGASFGRPHRIDSGNPAGRVSVAMLSNGSALVTWLERTGGDTASVLVRRVDRKGGKSAVRTIAQSSAARASGFPRMTVTGPNVVFAWTTATRPSAVRVARARVADIR